MQTFVIKSHYILKAVEKENPSLQDIQAYESWLNQAGPRKLINAYNDLLSEYEHLALKTLEDYK